MLILPGGIVARRRDVVERSNHCGFAGVARFEKQRTLIRKRKRERQRDDVRFRRRQSLRQRERFQVELKLAESCGGDEFLRGCPRFGDLRPPVCKWPVCRCRHRIDLRANAGQRGFPFVAESAPPAFFFR
jgi:hypothetical protein